MTTTTETKPPKVGDIFATSWGYDQTNVEFYEIVKVSKTGKSVTAHEIEQEIRTPEGEVVGLEYGTHRGRVYPIPGAFKPVEYYPETLPDGSPHWRAGEQVGRVLVTNKRIVHGGGFRVTSGSGWGVFAYPYDIETDPGAYETFAAGGLGH